MSTWLFNVYTCRVVELNERVMGRGAALKAGRVKCWRKGELGEGRGNRCVTGRREKAGLDILNVATRMRMDGYEPRRNTGSGNEGKTYGACIVGGNSAWRGSSLWED